MAYLEKHFQLEFTRSVKASLKGQPYVYHKISDQSAGEKPVDCFLIYNSSGILIELKQHNKDTAFAFNKVEDHQLLALRKAYKTGNPAYLVIGLKTKYGKEAVIYHIREWDYLLGKATKKSITVDDMRASGTLIKKDLIINDKKHWDLDEILFH